MKKALLGIITIGLFININLFAQQDRDKGQMTEYENPFWDEIKEGVKDFQKEEDEPRIIFQMDLSGYDLPKSIEEFTRYWYNDPISQGWSGMCWCFSTTSFFESEVNRIYDKDLKFSELHTVYWEYVEKARRYVRTHGKSLFAEGSQANAVKRIWEEYGCVPADIYTGMKPGQKFHGHNIMFKEMKEYLESVKARNAWNEDAVLTTIKSIMNYHIGEPPSEFQYGGKTYTPKTFLANVVKLNMDDYVDIMSLKMSPYWQQAEYKVPDNWWHDSSYYNVPLDDFMNAIKKSIKDGYTLFIGGDVSESGYIAANEIALVPSYDIPSDYIDDNARQFRFSNKSTTDDHGIHLVGYKVDENGDFWFLIKDSGSGSRNGANKGYYFYHEDYVKLKMMNFMVHKDAVKDLLMRF